MKIRFLKNTLQNRRFEYTPRYYDERKEALEQKRMYYKKMSTGELSDDERITSLRDNLRGEFSRGQYRQGQNRSANMRVLLLIVIIVALGYFVLYGLEDVDKVVNKLW